MPTVLLQLCGPLQAWGTASRFAERETGMEPSKSGVIGLICAALGRGRSEPLDQLAGLRMGVRVDREGMLLRDYQTIQPEYLVASGRCEKRNAVVSPRYYLCDAAFLVGLEGPDRALLETIQRALQHPVWQLYLGRKCCPPSRPVWVPGGLVDEPLEEVLRRWPRIAKPQIGQQRARLILEDPAGPWMRRDQPLGAFVERRFGPRFVTVELIEVPEADLAAK